MELDLLLGVKVIVALFAADVFLTFIEIFLDWRNHR